MRSELSHKEEQKAQKEIARSFVLLVLFCGVLLSCGSEARADIRQKDARRALQNMLGWALPSDAVHIRSVRSSGTESVEGTAEIQTVFRLRLFEEHWQLPEIRPGPGRWERLDVIARAAGVELPAAECD